MRGRSPGESSSVYPATLPPSMRLIHLAGRRSPSLHGKSRSTSPRFSLYLGGASSNGHFVSTHCVGTLVHCVGVSADRSDGTGSSERPCSATRSDTDIIVYKD